MSYNIFMIGFATAGYGLLVWLLVRNLVAAKRSARTLAPLKTAGEAAKLKGSDLLEAMKAAGGDSEQVVSIAGEMRRRIRRASEAGEVQAEREDLDTYWRVVRLFHHTFVPDAIEQREFPVRAYACADAATKRSVGQLMTVLRSEWEGAKVGLSDEV